MVPSGDPATVTAQVVGLPRSAGTATGTVTFSVSPADGSGQSLSCDGGDMVSLASGAATCSIATLGPAGSIYTVTASYSGDSTFTAGASNTRTVTVR